MPHPANITPAVFEKIITFLALLFLIPGTGDIATARETASTTLASYGARTDRELRFSALSIAFGFGALEALRKAADPDLPLNHVLRLRGNANALNRAAQQNENRLEKLRKQPPAASEYQDTEETPLDALADTVPASSATADLLAFARAKMQSMMPAATPASALVVPLSRQQRRAAERKAEKTHQRQQEEARRAQRLAAMRQPTQMNI
jgi:hypothetical protein